MSSFQAIATKPTTPPCTLRPQPDRTEFSLETIPISCSTREFSALSKPASSCRAASNMQIRTPEAFTSGAFLDKVRLEHFVACGAVRGEDQEFRRLQGGVPCREEQTAFYEMMTMWGEELCWTRRFYWWERFFLFAII